MFKSLQARLTLLFTAFVLLVIVSVGAMMWGSETQRQDALLLNLAGRQRMLAQQMVRLAFEAGVGERVANASLLESEQIFDQTLKALLDGGNVPYHAGTTVTLPDARDSNIRSALDEVTLTWGDFRSQLDALKHTPRDEPAFPPLLHSIEEKSSTLVQQADQVVRLYEAEATAKVNRLRAMQVGFLIAAMILLGAAAWITRQSALDPLNELSRAAIRLSENDFDTRVHVGGPREMQMLGETFEKMRTTLSFSRAELVELADSLERRVIQRTRELEALNEVSREIASQLDLPHVLNSVTEKARLLLDGESAMLCLLDDARQYLILKSVSGTSETSATADYRSEANYASAVLASQQALVCANAQCVSGCSIPQTHAASHVVAPLRIGDTVIGALCVTSPRKNHFTYEATEAITKLANTAAVALHNAQLYAQAEKAAVYEERNRIAADIHDGLGQTLSYLGLATDRTIELLAEGQDGNALDYLERMRGIISQATCKVRESIQQLLDSASRERYLPNLLRETIREFEGKYQAAIQWQAEKEIVTGFPREMAEQILNITREALENACKHAQAQSIRVQFGQEDGRCFIRIEDDGLGFDPDSPCAARRGHFGLRVMNARAAHIGGELSVESAPGSGSRVTLTFPTGEKK